MGIWADGCGGSFDSATKADQAAQLQAAWEQEGLSMQQQVVTGLCHTVVVQVWLEGQPQPALPHCLYQLLLH